MLHNEKRMFSRRPCEIDSAFSSLETGPERVEETVVQDISEGGVRFRATRFIPVHDRLLVRLRIPNQRTVEAIMQPAWIREIPSLSQYDIGAKFLSLTDSDREVIRAFTQNF